MTYPLIDNSDLYSKLYRLLITSYISITCTIEQYVNTTVYCTEESFSKVKDWLNYTSHICICIHVRSQNVPLLNYIYLIKFQLFAYSYHYGDTFSHQLLWKERLHHSMWSVDLFCLNHIIITNMSLNINNRHQHYIIMTL